MKLKIEEMDESKKKPRRKRTDRGKKASQKFLVGTLPATGGGNLFAMRWRTPGDRNRGVETIPVEPGAGLCARSTPR